MEYLAANAQENLVHSFQTAAAGKQLNQGVKGYGSKTPANKAPKTPFKAPLNDENAPFKGGKSVLKTNGKANQDQLIGGMKGADWDKNSFITPAGPRIRAPLGMKTTNAKAKAFQTPAPLSASTKTQKKTSPRLRRPKVKVHQAEPVKDDAFEEEREVEYMPPRGIPLPDEPEDWPSNMKYPMFEGANMTRGIESAYFNPVGDDGLTRYEREDLEQKARADKISDEIMQKALDDMFAEAEQSIAEGLFQQKKLAPEAAKKEPSARKPLSSKAPSTINSKNAAAALSPQSKPIFAAPIATTKSRLPSGFTASKKPTPMNPSATRHAAATTASRTTIGYSQGRAASSSVRKPLSNFTQNGLPSTTTNKHPTSATTSTNAKASTHKRSASQTTARSHSRSSSGATLTPAHFPKEIFSYETEEEMIRKIRSKELEVGDDEEIE
ncbi:hypothetical protein K432DRAFT_260225, partial [Lepidopterella palustris CBS 459.81]